MYMCFVSIAGGHSPVCKGFAVGRLSQRINLSSRIASSVSSFDGELLLADVSDEEDDGEDNAEGANHDVTDGQEVVLASEHVSGGENKVFLTLEAADIVVVLDVDVVLAGN
jgi:hypothetical protein